MYLLTLNRGLNSTHQLRRPGSRQESSSWEKGTPNAQRECGNPSFSLALFFFFSSPLSSLLLCSSPQILRSHIITSAHTIREGTVPLPSVSHRSQRQGPSPIASSPLPPSLCSVIPRQGHGCARQSQPFGQRLKSGPREPESARETWRGRNWAKKPQHSPSNCTCTDPTLISTSKL